MICNTRSPLKLAGRFPMKFQLLAFEQKWLLRRRRSKMRDQTSDSIKQFKVRLHKNAVQTFRKIVVGFIYRIRIKVTLDILSDHSPSSMAVS